jgi:hypothetical protein
MYQQHHSQFSWDFRSRWSWKWGRRGRWIQPGTRCGMPEFAVMESDTWIEGGVTNAEVWRGKTQLQDFRRSGEGRVVGGWVVVWMSCGLGR